MNQQKHPFHLTFLFLAGLFFAGNAASESLEIPGTGDAMGALQALAEGFNAAHPDHTIIVPPSVGSSGGIKAVGLGKARLGRVAREIKEKEAAYGLSYQPIAQFPVVFYVNKGVTVSNLTAKQVVDIFSGKITDWNAVGGEGRIRVVRREDGDSSLKNLRATFPGFSDLQFTPLSKITVTTQETLAAVIEIPGSIAFGPYADAMDAGMKVLSIDGKSPLDEGYPSYGVLALIYKEEEKKGAVDSIIRFILSDKGSSIIRQAHANPVLHP